MFLLICFILDVFICGRFILPKERLMTSFKYMLIPILLLLMTSILVAQDSNQPLLLTHDTESVYLQKGSNYGDSLEISINGSTKKIGFQGGKAILDGTHTKEGKLFLIHETNGPMKLYHVSKNGSASPRIQHIPLWLSIVPPLVAIILALIFKEVIIALFIGIWSGSFIAGGLRFESIFYWISSFLKVIQKYIINALTDSGHISVLIFSLLIGGMVAIISKNGGMTGIVQRLSRYAKDPTSTQFITWLLGISIFFDDYANTLIVGNTMRSVTDKFRISREKLAFIVDSTAAPVASIAFITTWIGAELGYISDGISQVPYLADRTSYSIFLDSLKYSYYPSLTLAFILLIIFLKRDYGPMYKAELRARTTGQVSSARTEDEDEPDMEDLSPVAGAPNSWWDAFIPVSTVIIMTVIGLVNTGMQSVYQELYPQGGGNTSWAHCWNQMHSITQDPGVFTKLGKVIGAADSYVALLWASLSGVAIAVIMTLSKKIMNATDTMHWLVTGFKTMMPALIILTLAWSLAITTEELHTAEYLSHLLEGNINPYVLPLIVFVLAAFISFSTGSSWSTMAILYPIAIPTSYAVSSAAGLDPGISVEIVLCVISTVLSASVLGDHCSPISDTTILSSLASDCNHLDHVKTQFPYAITVGIVSMICIYISLILGGSFYINVILYILAVGVLFGILKLIGKRTEAA